MEALVIKEAVLTPAVLEEIGRLRYDVWASEGAINTAQFPHGVWIDEVDHVARHWVAVTSSGVIVGSARLVQHSTIEAEDRDMALWRKIGRVLTPPIADLGRLVVRHDARCKGVASALNSMRVAAARDAGARVAITTASATNARLLSRIGFVDIGVTISFDDRPGVVFHAMECELTTV